MFLTSILRLTLVLVLSASPLVSSAMAASDGQWSAFWGDPVSGTVQTAEEEVGHEVTDLSPAETSLLWSEAGHALPAQALAYDDAERGLPPPPMRGDPTPPPERA